MTTSAKPIPDGLHTVTPAIVVRDAAKAIDFYKRALGAQELMRMPGPDGKIMHAELRIGDSVIFISDENPQMGNVKSPQSLGGCTVSLNVYVPNVDEVFKQAIAAGGKEAMAVALASPPPPPRGPWSDAGGTTGGTPGNPPPLPPESTRPCSIRVRKSGWQHGVSCPHHARSISRCEIEMTVINHAMFAGRRDHFAQQCDALAAPREDVGDLFDGIRLHDRDHADAAVEGAQQFEFGDAPLLRQPLENRQHRQTRKVYPNAEMFWQHARNIIGETAAGDVGKTLDRTGLADRAQA